MQIQDHVGIYQTPVGLDCIKWSQDNLLAVAAGQAITIFSPAALGGPRAFAPYRSVNTSVVAPGFKPKEWQDSPQFALSAFYEVNIKSAMNDQGWRNIAWSPVGCTVSGGCYLAALSADFKVSLLAPTASAMSSEWHEITDVTKLLQEHMGATDWKDVDCLAIDAEQPPAEAVSAMRLRGGCTTPLVPLASAGEALKAGASDPAPTVVPAEQVEAEAEANVLRLRGGAPRRRPPAGKEEAEIAGRVVMAYGSHAVGVEAGPDDDAFDASDGGHDDVSNSPPAKRVRRSGCMSSMADAAKQPASADADAAPGGSQNDLPGFTDEPGGLHGSGATAAAAAAAVAAADGDSGEPGPLDRSRAAAGPWWPQAPGTGASWDGSDGSGELVVPLNQLREGDRVEVHNDEDGLVGGWFSGRLIKLSAPQYGYGLVKYDDLQVSEEAGSPMLTEWFPLPSCTRLLSPEMAHIALPPEPDGTVYPVHSHRGYMVRPAPPSQVAPSPVPPPLKLGMMMEVLHEAAWWVVQLAAVTGPSEAVMAAATGVTAAAAGGSHRVGWESGVLLHGRLLHGHDAVAVPLERSRAMAVWDPSTGTWSVADVYGALLARPHQFRDVVLLEGGPAAAAILAPVLAGRVEVLKEAAEGAAREEGKKEEKGVAWASVVEVAGEEMLHAFAVEFLMLGLDGAWLWTAARERLAALQGVCHPDQLVIPSWAAPAAVATAAANNLSEGIDQVQMDRLPAPSAKDIPGPSAPGGSPGGFERHIGYGAGLVPAAVDGSEAACRSSGRGALGAEPSSEVGLSGNPEALDFSDLDPDTFRQYDTRPDPSKGGTVLERAAPGMIAKRFLALLSAGDPAELQAYVPGQRMSDADARLYSRVYAEFMYLYGSKLPHGADKRINSNARQRCRQILGRASKVASSRDLDAGNGGAASPSAAATDAANGAVEVDTGEGPQRGRGRAKRRRTLTADTLQEEELGAIVKPDPAEKDTLEESWAAAAAEGPVPAPGRRKSGAATPAAAVPRSARKGPGRRSRGAASDPPAFDFSGTDPDTFRQYETRLDPNEGGLALERAAPGMVFGRWQALIATVDPGTLHTYKPFEKMTGVELNMYDQAWGEFMYLYGDKLPGAAIKRINTEAKRRVRQLLRQVPLEDNVEGVQPEGSQQQQQPGVAGGSEQVNDGDGVGRTPLTTTSGRVARAAAVRAAAAARRQFNGTVAGTGSSEDRSNGGGDFGDAASPGPSSGAVRGRQRRTSGAAGGSSSAAQARRRSSGRRSLKRAEGGGDEMEEEASEYSLPSEAEESSDSSGSDSLGDEEQESESGAGEDGGEHDTDKLDLGDEEGGPRRGRGCSRGGRGGQFRGRGRSGGDAGGGGSNSQPWRPSREEEKEANAAATVAISEATRQIFEPLAPAINLDDPQMLQKHGGQIVYKRFIELRSKYEPEDLPAYVRGEHLRGLDLKLYVQAFGEFMNVFKGLLPPGADKKIKSQSKSNIRRLTIQSHRIDTGKPEKGSLRATQQQHNVMWTGKRRQGVREAAGVQGTLFMGYGEGGDGGFGDEGGLQAGGQEGGEGGAGAGAASGVQTWADTWAFWGRRSRLRYQVELCHGSAEEAEPGAPSMRQPSYGIHFIGYVKDDHRDLPLDSCGASDVSKGTVLPTAVYEARSLALAATCLAWSPVCCAANMVGTPAAPISAALGDGPTLDSAAQADGVSRYCVLAIGNKLGQVAMWRLGLPSEYEHRKQSGQAKSGSTSQFTAGAESGQQASRDRLKSDVDASSSFSSSLLQWMGPLQIYRTGAHVLRLVWCVAPEGGGAGGGGGGSTAEGHAAGAPAGGAADARQWHVPQPHCAGQRDSLLLLTGLSDGSILLWSAPAASLTQASDLTLISEICPPDGLALTAIDCTWLLLSDPHRRRRARQRQGTGTTATMDEAVEDLATRAKQHDRQTELDTPAQEATFHKGVPNGAHVDDGAIPQAIEGYTLEAGDDDACDEDGGDYDYGEDKGAFSCSAVTAEDGFAGLQGPYARRLLVVASKPCGAIFAWRSGAWRPRTAAAGGIGADKGSAEDLPTACSGDGGAASCLQPGAHGSYHCGGVALASGRPLIVSGGTDGAVKCWLVSELKLSGGVVPLRRRRHLPRALQLIEVPESMHRLDPCSAMLPELPQQVRSLTLARQAVHGVAASGNGLVFAVLRTTSTRQLDIAKNIMIHGRVLGGTVHLMTPYSMAAAALPPVPLQPRLMAAGLLFQAPLASCLWDIHAIAVRAGVVEAMALPPVPPDAWDSKLDREATADDDAAALEQVQGTEEGGNLDDGADGGGAGPGGNMDLGRARLAALVRLDTEERRRAKLTTRLQQLTATKLMLAAMERFIAPLEAPFNAAVAHTAANATSLYTVLGASRAWTWCGLRCATALRRLALSFTAARADPPGALPQEQLADVDSGVLDALQRAGGAAAAATVAPEAFLACRDTAARNEGELLQAHIWATLSLGIEHCMRPPVAVAGPVSLYRLLMADWVALHVRHPMLREDELLPLTVNVYLAADEAPPLDCTPRAREVLAISSQSVSLTGSDMLQSASVAECCWSIETNNDEAISNDDDNVIQQQQEEEAAAALGTEPPEPGPGMDIAGAAGSQRVVLTLPRCGATLAVCESLGVWNCVLCARRYLLPPTLRPQQNMNPPVPYCLFCGVRLGSGALGDNFLRQPSLPVAADVVLTL